MQYKRLLRLIALAIMIGLACVLPVPLNWKNKDQLPKDLIEHVQKNDDEADDESKELF